MALSKRKSDSILKQMLQFTAAANTPAVAALLPLQSSRTAQIATTAAQIKITVRRQVSDAILARRRIGSETISSNSASDLANIILCGAKWPNRYSATKQGNMPIRAFSGFGCVSRCLCYRWSDYDPESVPGKGCVRDCQPEVQIAGPVAGGAAGETLFAAHGGGLRAVGAPIFEVSSERGGGVDSSP